MRQPEGAGQLVPIGAIGPPLHAKLVRKLSPATTYALCIKLILSPLKRVIEAVLSIWT